MTVTCELCGGNRMPDEPVIRVYLRIGLLTTHHVIADADLCGPCRQEAEQEIAEAAQRIMTARKTAPPVDVKVVTGQPGLPGSNQVLGAAPSQALPPSEEKK